MLVKKTTVAIKAPRSVIQGELNQILASYHSIFNSIGGNKSFYVTSSDGTEFVAVNADGAQRSASTIKLFIQAAAYQKVARGELNMNANYTVKATDLVPASPILDGKAGSTYSLNEIARFMVQYSDNSATNIIIDRIGGIQAVNNEIRRMGYTNTTLNRYMRIQSQIDAGLENYINAQEASDLLKNIYNNTLQNNNSEVLMLNQLSNNYYNWWLTANLSTSASTWDKPGNDPRFGVENDIAVIRVNGRAYVVGLLTQHTGSNGLSYTSKFAQLGAAIAAIMRQR